MPGIFIYGLAVGIIMFFLVRWLRSQDMALVWYEWLLGAVGLLSVIFGVWHYFGSLAERQALAGLMGLLIFGVLGIIMLAVAWLLARRHQSVAG